MKIDLSKYRKYFSTNKLWLKLKKQAARIGQQTVYTTLLLYYAYESYDTPFWARNMVIALIGYLISPLDFLPDLTPLVGYTDDIGILAFGLVTVACYITDDVKTQARERHLRIFKEKVNETLLDEVDTKLHIHQSKKESAFEDALVIITKDEPLEEKIPSSNTQRD